MARVRKPVTWVQGTRRTPPKTDREADWPPMPCNLYAQFELLVQFKRAALESLKSSSCTVRKKKSGPRGPRLQWGGQRCRLPMCFRITPANAYSLSCLLLFTRTLTRAHTHSHTYHCCAAAAICAMSSCFTIMHEPPYHSNAQSHTSLLGLCCCCLSHQQLLYTHTHMRKHAHTSQTRASLLHRWLLHLDRQYTHAHTHTHHCCAAAAAACAMSSCLTCSTWCRVASGSAAICSEVRLMTCARMAAHSGGREGEWVSEWVGAAHDLG